MGWTGRRCREAVDARLPLRGVRRVHGPAPRREPAGRVHRRPPDSGRAPPAPGARDQLLGDGLRLRRDRPGPGVVGLGGEAEVAELEPDFARLARLWPTGTINCFAGSGRRWKTRAFAPGAGVLEDPATGSAAGPLACHLARHGRIAFGEEIEIAQGAEIGRPSTLFARVEGSRDGIERVEVGGSAVIVARAEFRLDARG